MTDPFSRIFLVVCSAGVAVVLIALGRKVRRVTAIGPIAAVEFWFVLGVEYSLRPLTILSDHRLGWDSSTFRTISILDSSAISKASFLSLLGVTSFAVGVQLGLRGSSPEVEFLVGAPSQPAGKSRGAIPPVLFALVGLYASYQAASRYGTVGGTFEGTFGRQNINSGYMYSLVSLAACGVVVAMAVLPRVRLVRKGTIIGLASAGLGFMLIHILILGGRAEILAFATSVGSVTVARFGRPKMKVLVLVALVAALGLGLLRVSTREVLYGENGSIPRSELVVQSLRNPIALITRGDVSAFDKLVILSGAPKNVSRGSTYLSALLAPIPGKSATALQSGNRVFTERFIPQRFARGVTYEGISLFGEARLNMGWLGIPLVGFLVGLSYGAILKRSSRSAKGLLVSALAMGMFPGLVRADAFNTVALTGSLFLVGAFAYGMIQRRVDRAGTIAGPTLGR